MIPMGTVVTVCMILGVVFGLNLTLLQRIPLFVRRIVGVIVLAAGLWNVLWYAVQHLTERWGIAALISGLLLILVSLYILEVKKLPNLLMKIRPVAVLLLLCCALVYGGTIYSL